MKHASWLLLLLAMSALSATISYYNEGLLRQPNDLQDRIYLRVTNLWPGSNVTFTPVGQGDQYINVGGTITNVSLVTNALWALYASNSIWSQYASNSIWSQYASNAIWALYSSNAISSISASNWIYSNTFWLVLQTNTYSTNSGTAANWSGSNALSVFSDVLCAGSNVWFTTNGGCFTINASNTGGGIAGSIYFTNVYGVAPGTNVTFSTNTGIVYINAVSNAAPGTNITSNLLAWWRFDEGTGTNTTDWTGNGNTGWLTNHTGGIANNPTWVPGKIGSYAVLMTSNLNQFVAVPTLVTQRIAGSITWWQWQTNVYNSGGTRGIWGWYKAATPNDWNAQVFSGNNWWYIGAGNTPECRIIIPADATNWPTNEWIHYAFTWGTNGQAFYANGVQLTNNVLNSGTNSGGGDYFHIGSLGRNGAWFSGAFDDFRIYTTNLTSAEIANLYQYYIDHMGDTNFVMKTGDTMTGPLVIESELTVNNNNVIITNGLILFYNGTYWCGWGVDAFGLYPGCNVSFGTSWLDGNGGIYFGRGFGWTNRIDDTGRMISGGPAGGFYGNGLGLTNIDLSAITNAWWLTNGYPWTNLSINASNIFWETNTYNMNSASLTNLEEVDSGLFLATGAGFLGNGSYLSNIYSTNLAPNSGVAILASNNAFTAGNSFSSGVTNSTTLRFNPLGSSVSACAIAQTNGINTGLHPSSGTYWFFIGGGLSFGGWGGGKGVFVNTDNGKTRGLYLRSDFANAMFTSHDANTLQMGLDNSTPAATTLQGPCARSGTDTDKTGGDTTFAAGRSTGTGIAGTLYFATGGSSNATGKANAPLTNYVALTPSGTLCVSNNIQIGGTLTATNGITVPNGSVTATNFITSSVKWIDVPMNYSYSVLGPSAPALTATTNGSVIEELAFDNNDILYAQAQMQHTVATTNAAFPNWYFEPHVHFTTIGTLDSTHSNVTWKIEWEFAKINGGWTSGTNTVTVGVTNNYVHYMAELGHLTNNSVPHLSSIFRCRLTRPASASEDYSNAHDVLLDGFDIHIPIGNQNAIGSSTDNAP